MRRVGQARRRDTVEDEIRGALEAYGATVISISGKGAPDVLVIFRGRILVAEIKSKRGTLTPAQKRAGAGVLWPVWRTTADALEAILAKVTIQEFAEGQK